MKTKRIIAICAAIGALALSARADLINAGFETGDFTGWSQFGTGWRMGTGADAYTGTYGAVNDVLTTDSTGFRGIFQNIPVTAGDTYSFSVYIRAVNVESSESWLEVQWINSSGGVIQQLESTHVTADQPFTQMTILNAIAPLNAVTASVRGIVWKNTATQNDTDFHIFDNFAVVPEPTSAGLLLIGGMIAQRVIRRQSLE